MEQRWAWAAYGLFALCLIGSVAWPLWSDSALWMFGFGTLGVLIILPLMLARPARAILSAFTSEDSAD